MPTEPIRLQNDIIDAPSLPMIYILGNSHSGSTLLSFLLASNPHIINLGEIKSKTWLKERLCSCGQPVHACPFYQDYFSTFNLLKKAAFNPMHSDVHRTTLPARKSKMNQKAISDISQLHASIKQQVTNLYPDARYWIDSSKSTWLLNAWLQVVPRKDIRIIWIRRNLKANVSSFVKRGVSFWAALIRIKINTFITSRFLKTHKLDYLEVNYDRFYEAYPEEAAAISSFLGIAVPSSYASHPNHHVISGNRMTRQSFTQSFDGLRKDDEWRHILSGPQQKIISWIS